MKATLGAGTGIGCEDAVAVEGYVADASSAGRWGSGALIRLARKVVELEIVPSLSHETVRQTLKKTV